jgi:hypothetical protein
MPEYIKAVFFTRMSLWLHSVNLYSTYHHLSAG